MMPHLCKSLRQNQNPPRSNHAARSIEFLEPRLLLSLSSYFPLHSDPSTRSPAATMASSASPLRAALAAPTSPPSAPLAATPYKRSRPTRIIPRPPQIPDGTTLLAPPTLPGSSKTVELSIGQPTGKTAQPLGVNIGSLSSYAQGNVINNLITQGGGFELSNGRVLVHASNGSTTTQLVIEAAYVWDHLGFNAAVGQTLVGSTGANINSSFTITAMAAQLDSAGNPTGNAIISIAGNFTSAPVFADSFYVQITNYASPALADKVDTTGTAAVTRDTATAHGGKSSAAFTFGSGSAANNSGKLTYYFGADTTAGRNVLRQGHSYQYSFWAKTSTAATAAFALSQGLNGGNITTALIADGQWHQYFLTVAATNAVIYQNGMATLQINGAGGKVNVDDVKIIDLSDQIAPGNPLSKDVVSLIQDYGFADLRFWIPELRFVSLDDLIGTPESRPMVLGPNDSYDPQLGLPEMLALAQQTHTAAWITLPTTWSATEMHNLMEYLGGSASSVYGAKRVADGHASSWFADLPAIYLEAGNESWNGTFYPSSYFPFEPYFARAQDMFHAVKTDPLYAANAAKLQLVANGWQSVPWFTEQAALNIPDADAIDVAAYTSAPGTDLSLNDLIAGALSLQQQVDAQTFPASIFGKKVYVYEENVGELGTVSAAKESAYATSLGAGLSLLDNVMTLTRDYGMSTQNLFTLFQRGLSMGGAANGYVLGHYGIFSDLSTAATNPRPTALGAKLLNDAKGEVLATSLSNGWLVDGSSTTVPTAITQQAANAMATFDGHNLVFTLFNKTVADLENTNFHFTLPGLLDGKSFTADWAHATFTLLTGPSAASNNETDESVQLTPGQFTHNATEAYAALPAYSMASFVIPIAFQP